MSFSLALAVLLFPLLEEPDASPDGAALFSRHCAVCHGEDGRATGEIAQWLRPRPRDFGSGAFRIVRTLNGVPTDDDLRGVLRRGMPGSAMPAFSWMSEAQIDALVAHVRGLAVDGLQETVARRAEWWEGRVLTPEEAHARAAAQFEPGPEVDVSVPEDPDGALRDRGARLYALKCQACHGPLGQGLGLRPPFGDGEPVWARDFTAGVMKGGATLPDLIRRIRAGLPGSGMPPTDFDRPEDAAAVALHVRSLLRPGADDRLVQRRQRIVARRVDRLETAAWPEDETSVVLAPMVWSDASIVEAAVAAMHDADHLALRVRWQDATHDADPLRGARFPDAVALQWSQDLEDPLFGMGSSHTPHDLWLWKAFLPEDVPGLLDLLDAAREGTVEFTPYTRHSLPAHASSLRAEGTAAPPLDAGAPLDVTADWQDGVWTVILRRALHVDTPRSLPLTPHTPVALALALWNGSAGDRGPRKSITLWHELTWEKENE